MYEQCYHFILCSTRSKTKLLVHNPFSNVFWQANAKLMTCSVLFTQLAASVRGCLFLYITSSLLQNSYPLGFTVLPFPLERLTLVA